MTDTEFAAETTIGTASERRAARLRALALVVILAALLGVICFVLRYWVTGPCSSVKLRRSIENLERVDDRSTILELEDELHDTLTEACSEIPIVGLPPWVALELWGVMSGEPSVVTSSREQLPSSAVTELCPEAHAIPSAPTLEDWNANRRRYEHCGFARFGLYDDGEATTTWIPPLLFWVSYARVLESGVDDELARRYFRLIAKVLDRQIRAPDIVIVEPGTLKIRSWHDGPPDSHQEFEIPNSGYFATLEPLASYDLLKREDFSLPSLPGPAYVHEKLVRLSLAPDTPARDLRWIVQARTRKPSPSGEFWLLLADFGATQGDPIVTAVRFADRHQWRQSEPPPDGGDLSLFITTEGWLVRKQAEPHGVLRSWAELESEIIRIMREADDDFELVIGLAPELEARSFLDVIRTIDAAMGPENHPWLRLPSPSSGTVSVPVFDTSGSLQR